MSTASASSLKPQRRKARLALLRASALVGSRIHEWHDQKKDLTRAGLLMERRVIRSGEFGPLNVPPNRARARLYRELAAEKRTTMAGPGPIRHIFQTATESDRFALMTEPAEGALLGVFLCHSSADKPAVRSLYKRLVQDNFRPWLDEEDLIPGQDWAVEIARAVRASDVVVVCLSRGSLTKEGFVQKEIRQALDVADEKPEGTIFIIPVRLEDCEVPERLRRWQWVNLFDSSGYDKLLRALWKRQGPQENGARAGGVHRPEQHGGNKGARTPAEEGGGSVPAKSTERPEIHHRVLPRNREGGEQTSVSSEAIRKQPSPAKSSGKNPIKKVMIVGGLALVGFIIQSGSLSSGCPSGGIYNLTGFLNTLASGGPVFTINPATAAYLRISLTNRDDLLLRRVSAIELVDARIELERLTGDFTAEGRILGFHVSSEPHPPHYDSCLTRIDDQGPAKSEVSGSQF